MEVVNIVTLLMAVVSTVNCQDVYKVCASSGRTEDCQALERGSSKVTCTIVSDSVECLMKMENGLADFAVFTAEETILAAMEQPDKYSVLAAVKQDEKRYQNFAFQAVALVRADHKGGLQGLSRGGLCHPGYGKGKEQLWSDRVLKYFEKKTAMASRNCVKDSKSTAEDDGHDLSSFYSAACRPGPWLLDPQEDKKLKEKFPTLCSLCTADGSSDCAGYRYFEPRVVPGAPVNSHLSALECLNSERGTVAYVAYNHVLDYFKPNMSNIKNYALLCENGTTIPLKEDANADPACAWVRQPWPALVSRKAVSTSLLADLQNWMPSGKSSSGDWVDTLEAILIKDKADVFDFHTVPPTPAEYIVKGRPLPVAEVNPCHKVLRWCVVRPDELAKCQWVQRVGLTLGIEPAISCELARSHVSCLGMIRDKRADFVSIDSNLGFLARKYYEETAVLFQETSRSLTSSVVALIKEADVTSITRFENLRSKFACFPEYGGIAWVSFVRVAHERKIFKPSECDYAAEVTAFFGAACAPGSNDPAHFPSKAADPAKLCAACRGFSPRGGMNEQGLVNDVNNNDIQDCPADSTNKFYGTKGALRCLNEPDSHVAFLETQYLQEFAMDMNVKPEQFRVLCRNGSLATQPGFSVDQACALSVTIDGEIIARRDSSSRQSIRLFLQELDSSFGYAVGSVKHIDFKIFSPFNGTKDLLFKDSTIGLARSDSDNKYVENYVELFKHVESCTGAGSLSGGAPAITATLTIAGALFVHFLML